MLSDPGVLHRGHSPQLKVIDIGQLSGRKCIFGTPNMMCAKYCIFPHSVLFSGLRRILSIKARLNDKHAPSVLIPKFDEKHAPSREYFIPAFSNYME